jgi:hypothetical protein
VLQGVHQPSPRPDEIGKIEHCAVAADAPAGDIGRAHGTKESRRGNSLPSQF